ncbi:MAG: type III-B CRISPR module RAMP protein Cmr4 [Acidobacteria bacterium]|nr:type III-B CRISPR module RAMP protein Cmr4 [Acidobacteriota bacterium]
MSKSTIQFFHAIEGVHNGAGQAIGDIDRPILREVTTGYPFLQGSSIQGAYRAEADSDWADRAFGKSERRGRIVITDARLLFFPVASLKNTLCWVTCPLALERYARWSSLSGDPSGLGEAARKVAGKAGARGAAANTQDDALYLFDRRIPAQADSEVERLASEVAKAVFGDSNTSQAWRSFFSKRAALVPQGDFDAFVRNATEVRPNNKLDPETGQSENLWFTEYLPSESILYSRVAILSESEDENIEKGYSDLVANDQGIVQIGADETSGKGYIVSRLLDWSSDNGDAQRPDEGDDVAKP